MVTPRMGFDGVIRRFVSLRRAYSVRTPGSMAEETKKKQILHAIGFSVVVGIESLACMVVRIPILAFSF